MKKILVLMEKWCDLNPNLGTTSANSNVIGSLHSAEIDHEVFYYDEYLNSFGKPIDEFLKNYICENDFSAVVVSYYPVRDDPRNVALETFRFINERVPVIFIWFDFGHPHIADLANYISEVNTLNVVVDVVREESDKFSFMWVPQDERVFSPGENKNIEVSFVGSRTHYSERNEYLNFILDKVPLCISGGQREHNLSIEDYANVLKRSKLTINFPFKSDGTVQTKCRVYEGMLCKAMLLECDNDAVRNWFTPMVHYVPFSGKLDLLNKISYYRENEKERTRITNNACEKMTNEFSSKNWWKKVLEKVKVGEYFC